MMQSAKATSTEKLQRCSSRVALELPLTQIKYLILISSGECCIPSSQLFDRPNQATFLWETGIFSQLDVKEV